MGATAIVDVLKVCVHNDYALYASIWGVWRIVEICWLTLIAGHFFALLNPRYMDTSIVRIPYVIVVSAAILNGPPHTMNSFYTFQSFGLLVCVLVVGAGVVVSLVERFEEVAIAIGILCALQAFAGEVMVTMGYHPALTQILWLAGLIFIAHTIFRYEPDLPAPIAPRRITETAPTPRDAQAGT